MFFGPWSYMPSICNCGDFEVRKTGGEAGQTATKAEHCLPVCFYIPAEHVQSVIASPGWC